MIRYLLKADVIKYYQEENQQAILLHCISNDWALGAGVAKAIDRTFEVKKNRNTFNTQVGQCVPVSCQSYVIGNLITKELYWHKPTYETLTQSLLSFRGLKEYQDHKIYMPAIGCGLDRLKWEKVSYIISEILFDRDILVCLL